jgi:hypothetical protein
MTSAFIVLRCDFRVLVYWPLDSSLYRPARVAAANNGDDFRLRLTRPLTRRQRPMFGHFLVQSDDFRIARQFPDRCLYLFSGERRGLAAH